MKHKLHDKFYRKVTKSLLYWKYEWPLLYNHIKLGLYKRKIYRTKYLPYDV